MSHEPRAGARRRRSVHNQHTQQLQATNSVAVHARLRPEKRRHSLLYTVAAASQQANVCPCTISGAQTSARMARQWPTQASAAQQHVCVSPEKCMRACPCAAAAAACSAMAHGQHMPFPLQPL